MKKLLTERFQQLAGIKPLYTLKEAANTDLELKSFAKQLYSYAKKEGAQAFLVDFTKMSSKQLGGKVPDTNKPSVFIQISNGLVSAKMVGNGVDQLYKDMVNSYPKFEFGEYKYSDKQAFPPYEGVIPMITFIVKPKSTGKKGGVMATESLNENRNRPIMKKLLTERFQELAGIKPLYQMEEGPGEDLELKSLAKKMIPTLKKLGFEVEYSTDTSMKTLKNAGDKFVALRVQDGMLGAHIPFKSGLDTAKEIQKEIQKSLGNNFEYKLTKSKQGPGLEFYTVLIRNK